MTVSKEEEEGGREGGREEEKYVKASNRQVRDTDDVE